MSVLEIAEALAGASRDSVQHIVLSHELNMKIAKEQSTATLRAGWAGVVGAVTTALLTFCLGYFIGTSPAKVTNDSEREKAVAAPRTQPNQSPNKRELPASAPDVPPSKPAFVGNAKNHNDQASQASGTQK